MRHVRADLAVTSSGPRLHLDSKYALDLAILSKKRERNELVGGRVVDVHLVAHAALHLSGLLPTKFILTMMITKSRLSNSPVAAHHDKTTIEDGH